jgi:hypothetical protein
MRRLYVPKCVEVVSRGDAPLRLSPILLVGVLTGTVYCLTLAPSLTWSHWGTDGGDFVTAAVTGRLPHPPGFPTYYLLSRIWVAFLPGDPARLLNGLSALMATGAACWTTAAVLRASGVLGGPFAEAVAGPGADPQVSRAATWAAIAAGLSLGWTSWLWSQAVITEVYTTAAFLTSLAIFLASGSLAKPCRAWCTGLILGLAASVHLTALAWVLFILPRRDIARSPFLLGIGIGLLPYALLPFTGAWPQPWGDLRSFGGWWHYVSGRLYWGNAFGLPLSQWPQRLLAWAGLLARQFTPLGAFVALLGLHQLWLVRRRSAGGIVLALGVVSLYAIGYNSADSWVYLIAYLPILALLLGLGLIRLAGRRIFGGLTAPNCVSLIIPLLLLFSWSDMNLQDDYETVDWLEATLAELPMHAVVLTEEDAHTFALWYALDALERRQDVMVVDTRLWGFHPYVGFIRQRSGLPESPSTIDALEPSCEIGTGGEMQCW